MVTARLAPHARVSFELAAKSGAKTEDALGLLKDLHHAHYDIAITALGVNDVTKGISLRKWLRLQTALLDQLAQQSGTRQIIVSGLPPVGQFPLLPNPLRWVLGRQSARFDRHLHAVVAGRPNCASVTIDLGLDKGNMAADGFHPGASVYAA